MGKGNLFKGVFLGLVVATTAASEARLWELNGALLDSSQNLYTASYYPSSANLRVSKRSSTNSSVWVHDFAAGSGWRFRSDSIVRRDSAGNIWIAARQEQTSGTNTRLVVYKLNSSGNNAAGSPAYYAPAAAGQSVFLGGFALDSADKPILVGSYNTSTYTQGFAVKYTSFPTGSAQGVNITSYHTMVDDLQIDASNNIYVASHSWPSAGSTTYATITKFTSAFGAGTNYSDTLPSAWFPQGGGCLTLDSSGLLTLLIAGSDGINPSDVYGIQRNTSGTATWVPGLLGFNDMQTNWSTVDASGNIYVTGAMTNASYEVAKISPSKTVLWDSVFTPATPVFPRMIALDAGGDPLVIAPVLSGSNYTSRVMRFNNSTGVNSANYSYSGAGGQDYGYAVLPSPTTSGVFYATGVGLSGGSYYPLTYKYTVGGSPALTWSNYQTAVIP